MTATRSSGVGMAGVSRYGICGGAPGQGAVADGAGPGDFVGERLGFGVGGHAQLALQDLGAGAVLPSASGRLPACA